MRRREGEAPAEPMLGVGLGRSLALPPPSAANRPPILWSEPMAPESTTKAITAEQFLETDWGDGIFELVRGEVVRMTPPRSEHGLICWTLSGLFWDYVRRAGLGYCFSNDAAIVTERNPDTVRGPDLCYYSEARWPRSEIGRTPLPPVAPDLAVEVVSPSNRPGAMLRKVGEYLDAGVLLIWVVDPRSRTLTMYRPDAAAVVLREDQTIEDLPELPGFHCAVADIFR